MILILDDPPENADIKFIYEPDSNPPRGAFDIPANKNCEAKARGRSLFCSSLGPQQYSRGSVDADHIIALLAML